MYKILIFKRLILVLSIIMLFNSPAFSEDKYDPYHTILALNMATVSVHKIVSTQDRIVLEQEYQSIINNLNLGNIKSDPELTALYTKLLDILTHKRLRQDEIKRLQNYYDNQMENRFRQTLKDVQISSTNLIDTIGEILISCISSYFNYIEDISMLNDELNKELSLLNAEDIEDFNALQKQLLTSSWSILNKYHISDAYRLTQKSIDLFYQALQEADKSKKLRMLRSLEGDFSAYPPYWFYRAKMARDLNNISEAEQYLKQFDHAWRPVLRKDPYKVEATKYKVQDILKSKHPLRQDKRSEILKYMDIIRENTLLEDWVNNIFSAMVYFLINEQTRAEECIRLNIDFGIETTISELLLQALMNGDFSQTLANSQIIDINSVQSSQNEPNQHEKTEKEHENVKKSTLTNLLWKICLGLVSLFTCVFVIRSINIAKRKRKQLNKSNVNSEAATENSLSKKTYTKLDRLDDTTYSKSKLSKTMVRPKVSVKNKQDYKAQNITSKNTFNTDISTASSVNKASTITTKSENINVNDLLEKLDNLPKMRMESERLLKKLDDLIQECDDAIKEN